VKRNALLKCTRLCAHHQTNGTVNSRIINSKAMRGAAVATARRRTAHIYLRVTSSAASQNDMSSRIAVTRPPQICPSAYGYRDENEI